MASWILDNRNDIICQSRKSDKVKHKKIKKFSISGIFKDDAQIPTLRASMERELEREAREKGYVPVLELDTLWATSYSDPEWQYISAMYCVYVGKRKARECEGWQNGKLIPRPTQNHTSEQSSEPSASE